MNVLLLAGGLGSRLAQYTITTPKCLLPVKQVPILGFWMEKLLPTEKIKNVYVNTHHHQDQVIEYLKKTYPQTIILREPILLGTAGTLFSNLNLFRGDDLLVIHVDLYSSINMNDFLAIGNALSKTDCLVGVFKPRSLKGCGIFQIENNLITSFLEKPKIIPNIDKNSFANGAIYLFKKDCLEFIQSNHLDNAKDIAADILPKILSSIKPYYITGHHIDIGTIEGFNEAQII